MIEFEYKQSFQIFIELLIPENIIARVLLAFIGMPTASFLNFYYSFKSEQSLKEYSKKKIKESIKKFV